MRYIKKLLPALLLCLIISCNRDDSGNNPTDSTYPAGIVLTFDDIFIDDWYAADAQLQDYNWKATFFITQYEGFTDSQKDKLYALEQNGHEIGGHGLNHLHANAYVTEYGFDAYFENEIDPMINIMGQDGYTLHSFAYPYGERSAQLDNRLFTFFNIIRGTTYGQLPPEQQNCFYTGNRLIYALGIDQSYPHANLTYLKSLMQYAKDHNKIVIFYGHQIVDNVNGDYQTPIDKLTEICKFANELGLKFYKVNELSGL